MAHIIYLYNEIPEADLDIKRALRYLADHCRFIEIELRRGFIAHFFSNELIGKLADCWNNELSAERGFNYNRAERLDYENLAHLKPGGISPQIIYNGWQLLKLLQAQIPRGEASPDKLHLILTPRLLVTMDEGEPRRQHARTIIMGQPSIISASGLVEAPARSAEYYLLERAYQMLGQDIPEAELEERFAGKFLTYHDPRLTEVMLGYIMQAIAYSFMGEGFCDDPHCRLFNAHLQAEMLTAQLEAPEFCEKHRGLFNPGGQKTTLQQHAIDNPG